MKEQNQQLIIPLPIDIRKNDAYLNWLCENRIEYKCIKAIRQAKGFPPGWTYGDPALEFEKIEDAMAFKLRWL
ncbi:hypothetical protein LCGC14_2380000 [marine sediment metagenome]|uniref:Uncharacterized protein n=1 Tax=marine sediment metagenome TaxID=412755 RepID=A0A0F9CND2_9ZZZZ